MVRDATLGFLSRGVFEDIVSRHPKASDHLARHGIQLVWGPGRHIIGHNVAAYHRNADNVRVELYCEMDQMADERLGYFDPRPWHGRLWR